MDIDQEDMQFLGLFGIYKESYKLIFRLRKIFSQITLALILPLSLIFLAHDEISEHLYWRIRFTEFRLHCTKAGTPKYDKLSDLVSSEWAAYILFEIAYFSLLLAFSLLSTSAVVYAIACAYTSREIAFKKVMSVVPKVWKRLFVTFLCAFLAFVAYNFVHGVALYFWRRSDLSDSTVGIVLFFVILITYCVGFVYMTIIWQMASVVSVLEEAYGIKAMIKSRKLIKGKMVSATILFFMLNLLLVIIHVLFRVFVVWGGFGRGVVQALGFGVLCLVLLMKLILLGLVAQTVLFFVCKSYHHENIDKSALSDHLEVIYLGDYVPLKAAKDIQMEEYYDV